MMRKLLLTLALGLGIMAQAQLPGESDLESFRQQASAGQPGISAYDALYRAFQGYSATIASAQYGSPDFVKSKAALVEIYPRLADAAYFFASLNDQEKVLKYACAYVDVSLIPCMESENCQRSAQYPILANLAATNLYNRRDYDRSITYFQAYLESGDTQARETAFEGLARCLFEQKDFGRAANICFQATKIYPANWNILIIGIESCGHNGNDTEMEQMLTKALAIQPSHRGLLEYQGKLFERQRRYDAAAETFRRLCSSGQPTLDHITHMAFDYYNAATLDYTRAKSEGRSTAQAERYFALAAPELRKVLDQSPYAANVARALATCYSLTNDATRLNEANKTLASLHSPTVNFGALPTLVQNYVPSPEVNPVSTATTAAIAKGEDTLISDVDINIPETHLKSPNTHVLIIANENYKNAEVQKVDFAHRDGDMFGNYCRMVLGVDKDHIRIVKDATLAEMRSEIDRLAKLSEMMKGKMDLIVYYAGHGTPDFAKNKSYLVPADVAATDLEFCYDLEKLYGQLDNMQANRVTVFLDACFSGATRGGGMVASGRYVRKAEADVKAAGKTVVFSAASGEQAACAYKDQGHGYFTYFLLKALQESRGKITLAELAEQITDKVKVTAWLKEKKEQTPTVKAAEALGSAWKSRTLVD